MSMFKKLKTIGRDGFDPFLEGKKNYERPTPYFEKLAAERAEICKKCPLFETEPIGFLRVEDERVRILSDKMCGDCGCSLPYLLRQDLKICKKWQKSTNT